MTTESNWQFAGELAVKAMLVAGTTSLRTGLRMMELTTEHAPGLMQLASDTAAGDADAEAAKANLREGLVTLAREVAEAGWQEARRGVDDFDLMTRPDEDGGDHNRPWRVKP